MLLAATQTIRAGLDAKTANAIDATARLPRDHLLFSTQFTRQLLHDPRADLARAERSTDVACAFFFFQRALHDPLEPLLFVRMTEVREHHPDAEHGRERIGEVAPGDVRRRTVHRLEETDARPTVRGHVQARARRHA